MKDIINGHIELINESLEWSKNHKPSAMTDFSRLKADRRLLDKINFSLDENCSAAVYGESQVGKSYVVGSLLSSSGKPFLIEFGDKKYNFVNEINSSGGNNSQKETTGIITRFTTRSDREEAGMVRIKTLSIVDIILLLADSYYKEVDRDLDEGQTLTEAQLNQKLAEIRTMFAPLPAVQNLIGEDDIINIEEYFRKTIKGAAQTVVHSDFKNTVSECVHKIAPEKWTEVFGLLWNENEEMSSLFTTMIGFLRELNFARVAYVPCEAVLRKNGTLLDVAWLDSIFDKSGTAMKDYPQFTDVYDADGNVLKRQFPKSHLSALIAELTLVISENTAARSGRDFLRHMDLLDFPGLRRREDTNEKNISKERATVLRRGKITYLFNKYSSARLINALLFCQHNDQSTQGEMAKLLDKWINENIANSEHARTEQVLSNGGSPFFIVATKFNKELEYGGEKADDMSRLTKKWTDRFVDVLEREVLKAGSFSWFHHWTIENGHPQPFRNIFLLRSYAWSARNHVFLGYKEGVSPEERENIPPDYPDFRKDLRKSFVECEFARKHFADPAKSWDGAATLNNDGSQLIIDALNRLAPNIENTRREKYRSELTEMAVKFVMTLNNYCDPDDPEEKIKKIKQQLGDIRFRMENGFAKDPSVFGKAMQSLMVDPADIRQIVHRIINNYSDTAQEINPVNFIRMTVGIDPEAPEEVKKAQLCAYYDKTWDELVKAFKEDGVAIEDILSKEVEVLSTRADVVVARIIEFWTNFLDETAAPKLNELIQNDRVTIVLRALFSKLGMKSVIAKVTDSYLKEFDPAFAPNVIADSISLIINNFSTSFGSGYMQDEHFVEIDRVAGQLDMKMNSAAATAEPGSIAEVINALELSTEYLRQQHMTGEQKAVLRKLPLYDNYWRWDSLLAKGIILANDVPDCDPVANKAICDIITGVKQISYK